MAVIRQRCSALRCSKDTAGRPEEGLRLATPTFRPDTETALTEDRDYVRVFLRDVVTEARVGLHPWEQHAERPTRLLVNVEMCAGRLEAGEFLDYDRVREAIRAWPSRPHTELLETLAEELVAVCLNDPRVTACRVCVAKPDIFNDAAAAGVEIFRARNR